MDNIGEQLRGTQTAGYAAGSIASRVEFEDRGSKKSNVDFIWLALFLAGLVAHLGLGIFMVASQNVFIEDGVASVSDSFQQEINDCVAGPGRRSLEEVNSGVERMLQASTASSCDDLWCVFNKAAYIPTVTILLVPVIGLLWMIAMYNFPRVVVWGSVLTSGALYSLFGIMLVAEGVPEAGAIFLVLAGASFVFLFVTAGAVNKAAEHVRAAMVALNVNRDIFVAAFVLEVVMLAFLGLNWWFMIAGSQILELDEFCRVDFRSDVREMWLYQFVYLFWFVSFCDMGKMVVTAMGVGAWYFETPPQNTSTRPAFLGLKATFSTSAGAVAAGSFVAGLFDYILEKTSSSFWWMDPALIILKCIVTLLHSCIIAFTRFAMIAHAFSGEGFFNSATSLYPIMAKNFLGGYVTDRVATTVVAVGSQAVAIAVGTLAWFWIDQDNGWTTLEDLTGDDSVFGGLLGFFAFIILFLYVVRRPMLGLTCIGFIFGGNLVSFTDARIFAPIGGIFVACLVKIILQFQGSVMLNTIDTMFICYALGKENDNQLGKPLTGGRELVYAMMVDIPEAINAKPVTVQVA